MDHDDHKNNETVLVTGASGYLAGYIIKLLLERNYNVRATVRSLNNHKIKYKYLYKLAQSNIIDNTNNMSIAKLELVEADLTKDEDNWNNICADVSYVFHIANPNVKLVYDGIITDKEYIDVIINGINMILNGCKLNKSFSKFVYCSSQAAMGAKYPLPNEICNYITSDKWQDINVDGLPIYSLAKTLAEKNIFKFMNTNFEICSICPGGILEPLLNNNNIANGHKYITLPLNGNLPMIPLNMMGIVDVRDVAITFCNTLTAKKNLINGKRYVCISQAVWMYDICRMLYAKYRYIEGYNVSLRLVKYKFVFRIMGLFNHTVREIIIPTWNRIRCVDNTQTIKDLGVIFRPIHETIYDAADSLIAFGFIKKQSKLKQCLESILKYTVIIVVIGFIAGCVIYFAAADKEIPYVIISLIIALILEFIMIIFVLINNFICKNKNVSIIPLSQRENKPLIDGDV